MEGQGETVSQKCETYKCTADATWFIGTARICACDEHHKNWLQCFSFKDLQKDGIEAKRIGQPR